MSAYDVAALWVTYVSALIPWAFIVAYHLVSRGAWRRDPMGWHIMAITAVDAMIFTMAAVGFWMPLLSGEPVWRWTGLMMVAGIPAVTVWRGVILWRLYRERPATARVRRPRHPVKVWQAVLAVAQVAAAEFTSGRTHGYLALAVGTAQVALGFYAYGRARANPPAVSTSTQ